MKFLKRHRLCDGNRERRVSIDIFAEKDALCPRFGSEVDLALLHRNLPRRGFAGSTGLRPDHLDGEKIAGDKQRLLGDAGNVEGLKGNFYCCFHRV